ncbi:placenta-specific gene 8 protein-like [Dreissena polymorpha]|uniref:Uncharacterized protein n=1 Tax=Dreissena polymorpha TaxID=45954 RepID=A0A9D4D8W3_DREPO|nr:placenta-specific gene 8 protein-like [Dreissena polymorpha]KAH3739398.1 hypothetical protein DPMN_046050 [Dreissena polymorpha]
MFNNKSNNNNNDSKQVQGQGYHGYPAYPPQPHGGFPSHVGNPQYGVVAPNYGGNYSAPIINQPTVQSTNVAVNIGGTSYQRPWSTQLCGCMEDVGGCCCALCFFPCFVMTLATRMQEFCFLPFCVPNALLPMRVKIRAENDIEGSICKDCYCTYCCAMLTACQMKRELDNIDKKIPATQL